jgi:hypothetical protein
MNPLTYSLEHQRRVLPAEAVDAADGDVQLRVARFGRDVERAAIDRLARVDGRRDLSFRDREGGRDGFDAVASGEIAGLRLDRSERHALQTAAEDLRQSVQLRAVMRGNA